MSTFRCLIQVFFFVLLTVNAIGCSSPSTKVGVEYEIVETNNPLNSDDPDGPREKQFRLTNGQYKSEGLFNSFNSEKKYTIRIKKKGFQYRHPVDGTWPVLTEAIKKVLLKIPGIPGDQDEELAFFIAICTYEDKSAYKELEKLFSEPLRINADAVKKDRHDWFLPTFTTKQVKAINGVTDVKYWLGYADDIVLSEQITLDAFKTKGETELTTDELTLFTDLQGDQYVFLQILVFEETGFTTLKYLKKKYGEEVKWKDVATMAVKFASDGDVDPQSLAKKAAKIALYYGVKYYTEKTPRSPDFAGVPVGTEYKYMSREANSEIPTKHVREWNLMPGDDKEVFKLELEVVEQP